MLPELSNDDLKEFQSLWKKETGQDISLGTAGEYAADVIGLVEIVARSRENWQSNQA